MNLGKPDSASLWKQIVKEVELAWPTDRWRDVGVVIGCSGGADSVALVRALSSLQQLPPSSRHLSSRFPHRCPFQSSTQRRRVRSGPNLCPSPRTRTRPAD